MFYSFVRFVTGCVFRLLFPITIVGIENIPMTGACLFACNHRSYLDPMLVPVASPRTMHFVAKKSLFDHWLLGPFLRRLGAFPITRERSDMRAVRMVLDFLADDQAVLIFPEGTRVQDPQKSAIRAGIGFLTVKSGAPVVPIYVGGSDMVLPPGKKRLSRHSVIVIFGEPMHFPPTVPYEKIAAQVMERINALPLEHK